MSELSPLAVEMPVGLSYWTLRTRDRQIDAGCHALSCVVPGVRFPWDALTEWTGFSPDLVVFNLLCTCMLLPCEAKLGECMNSDRSHASHQLHNSQSCGIKAMRMRHCLEASLSLRGTMPPLISV